MNPVSLTCLPGLQGQVSLLEPVCFPFFLFMRVSVPPPHGLLSVLYAFQPLPDKRVLWSARLLEHTSFSTLQACPVLSFRFQHKCHGSKDFPGGPVLSTLPPNAGVQVRSLVGELRSHMPHAPKPKHKTVNIVTNSVKTLKVAHIKKKKKNLKKT